ncbi:hypothetical protein PsYK624_123240 [Phanerochaete sordida]|uniref:Jacalin-type lectin domain-containing protein n=1 Tax=Phanerochaete sordida TaxID=48140 RepID=A0A9P3LI30_9APHY|nr:hypothetical protein PsYK624_123240 [Phanerochaete sordida]
MYPDGTKCVTLTPGERLGDVRSYMSSSHGDVYVADQLQVTPQLIETSLNEGFTPKAVQWLPTRHGGAAIAGSSLCSYSWGTGAWSLFYQIEVEGGIRLREYYFNNSQWNDTHLDIWSVKLGSSVAVMDAPASGKPPTLVFQDTSDNICVFPLVKERRTQVDQPPNMSLTLATKAKPLTGIGACVDSDHKTKRVYYQDSQGVIREQKAEGGFWDIVQEPVSDALPGVVGAISAIGDGQYGARVYALQSNGTITEYKRSGLKWFPTPVKTRTKPLSSANIVSISAPVQGILTGVLWIGDDRRLYVNDCQSDGRWRGPRALLEFRYDEAKNGLRPGNRTPFDRLSTGSGAVPATATGATHGSNAQQSGECATPDGASTHHGSTPGGTTSTSGPHQSPHGERAGVREQSGHASGTRPPQPGAHTSPPSTGNLHGGSAATEGPQRDGKGAGVGAGGQHTPSDAQQPLQGGRTPGAGGQHGATPTTHSSQQGGNPLTPGDSGRRIPSEPSSTPTSGTRQPDRSGLAPTNGQSGQHGAASGGQRPNGGAHDPTPEVGGQQGPAGDRRPPGVAPSAGAAGSHMSSSGGPSTHHGDRTSTSQHGGAPGGATSQVQGGSTSASGRGGSEPRGPTTGTAPSSVSTPRPTSGVPPSTNGAGDHSAPSGGSGLTPATGADGHPSSATSTNGLTPTAPSLSGQHGAGADASVVHPTSPSPNGHATDSASAAADAATSTTAAAKYRPGKVIRRVCMHIKRGVEGLKVVYDNGQETAWRGLSTGDERTFELESDEYITHVWYAADGGIVQGLLFGTSFGRESPWFGSQYGIFGLHKNDGSVLVDLEGPLNGGPDSLKPTWEAFSPMGDSIAHEAEFNTLLGEFGKFQAGVSELKGAVHGMTDLATEDTAEAFKVLVQNVEILRNQEDGIKGARVTANALRETYRTAHLSACRKSVETLLKLLEELSIKLKPMSGEFASAVEDRRQEGEALYKKLSSLLDKVKQYRQKLGTIADGLTSNQLFWFKEVEKTAATFAVDKTTFKQTMEAKGIPPLEPEDDYATTLWGLEAWRHKVNAKVAEDPTVHYIINSTMKSNSRAQFTRSQVDFLKATASRLGSLMKKLDDLSGRITQTLETLRSLIDGLGDHQPERNSAMKGAAQLLDLVKKSIHELETVKAADDSHVFAKPTHGVLGPLLQNSSFKWGSVKGQELLDVSKTLC